MAILETIGLEKRFGGIVAAHDVSLDVEKGARHALIGPNGAGKTTVINLLTGVLEPTAGRILLDGARHHRARSASARAARHGAHVPDQPAVRRPDAARDRSGSRSPSASARAATGGGSSAATAAVTDEIVEMLERFRLADVMHERTATLPYGKQRLLEIALALACRPRVLLLDEPAAGVPEAERHEFLDTVAALPRDVTVLLIEHDMDLVFRFADRISVLVNGALLVEARPTTIARDPRVQGRLSRRGRPMR